MRGACYLGADGKVVFDIPLILDLYVDMTLAIQLSNVFDLAANLLPATDIYWFDVSDIAVSLSNM